MRQLSGWVCALVLGLGLLPALAQADRFDRARGLIQQHMAKNKVPGMSVAVWRDGQILWEEGFGWADMENRVAATENTMFSLASLSKTLTAVGVMTLAEAGKVDLDRPANDYLGQDKITTHIGDPKAVTVRRVTNHTSGLADSDRTYYGKDVASAADLGEVIRRYGIVVAPPGERWRYSNLGYDILGRLIGQVSGKSYADYMRENVFLPLGMTHSSVDVAAGLEKHQALRYDFDRKPIPFYVSSGQGAGSVYASAHDLARFGMFFLKNRIPGQAPILSDASIDHMTRHPMTQKDRPARDAGDGDGYALGWLVRHLGHYRVIGHAGSMSGVNSEFSLVPAKNLGVVLLANADGGAPASLVREILRELLPDLPAASPSPRSPAPPFTAPAALLGSWQGDVHTYEGKQPIRLDVLPSGEVRVRIGGALRFGEGRSNFSQDALLNRVAFEDGELSGTTLARLETSDTQRTPYTVSLKLTQRGDLLNGTATAVSVFDGFWLDALPYWAELKKVSGGQ